MTKTAPRVMIHSDDATGLMARLNTAIPEAEATVYDRYEGMEDALARFKPDVVYSVRFGGTYGYPVEAMLGPHGPEWLSVGGSGCDHLGVWDTGKVTVTNAAGVAADMMAEFVFGCLFHFTLDIPGLQQTKAAHEWKPRLVTPLKGKTMLIVGLGQTGQAVAARAQAMGMHVLGTRARPAPTENVDEVHAATDLPKLWGRADVIVVCVPLLPSTRGLIGMDAFALMKPSALLVDVSRGGVIDGMAVLNALTSGQIVGAGLDVFELEPLPEDSPLWDAPNLILSPHSSAVYDGWGMASFEMFIENLKRWQSGATLRNIVSPDLGY